MNNTNQHGNVLIIEGKNKPIEDKYFCNAGIKGIRDLLNVKSYKFLLLENHSEQCERLGLRKKN